MTAKKYLPERGDIVYLNFDPTFGHEQRGRRPAVILSRKEYNKATKLCLAVPITSKVKGYIFEVGLNAKLKTEGVVLADQVKSFAWIDRKIEFVEKIEEETLEDIYAKIKTFLE